MEIQGFDLTPQQKESQAAFRAFVDQEIAPIADEFDRQERIPAQLVARLAEQGYWGAELPPDYGGAGMDMLTYGLLTEEIGRGSADVRNLVGVQGMVATAILKWGSKEQRQHWLPKMAAGEVVAAFALTEPDVGSDAKSIKTTATLSGAEYVLDGRKKWISFGQNADLFLIFVQCEGKPTAFLVERERAGLATRPLTGLLGFRGSMLAELHLEACRVPAENLVARVGFGLSHVASYGLTHGRYSTAWGCVGLAQACLEACLRYTSERRQFDAYLKEHQLVQGMVADMLTQVTAARLLCCRVGQLMEAGDLRATMEVAVAKYFASTMAVRIASDAVQLHGANGCGAEYPVQRYLRDAKIMEIIEGSTQVQQVLIAKHAYREFGV